MPHSRWGEISIVQRLIVLGDYDTLSQGITMTDGEGGTLLKFNGTTGAMDMGDGTGATYLAGYLKMYGDNAGNTAFKIDSAANYDTTWGAAAIATTPDVTIMRGTATGGVLKLDSETNDCQTATDSPLQITLGVNSCSVSAIDIDALVRTELSSAEMVSGINIQVGGDADDAATSIINGIYIDERAYGTLAELCRGIYMLCVNTNVAKTTTYGLYAGFSGEWNEAIRIVQDNSVDSDTADRLLDGSLINIDLGTATNVASKAIDIDVVASGALGAGDFNTGIEIDITGFATDSATSTLYGINQTIAVLSANAQPVYGNKQIVTITSTAPVIKVNDITISTTDLGNSMVGINATKNVTIGDSGTAATVTNALIDLNQTFTNNDDTLSRVLNDQSEFVNMARVFNNTVSAGAQLASGDAVAITESYTNADAAGTLAVTGSVFDIDLTMTETLGAVTTGRNFIDMLLTGATSPVAFAAGATYLVNLATAGGVNLTQGDGITVTGFRAAPAHEIGHIGAIYYNMLSDVSGLTMTAAGTVSAVRGSIINGQRGLDLYVNAAGATAIPINIDLAQMQGGIIVDVDFTAAETLTATLTGISLNLGANITQGGFVPTAIEIITTPVNDTANASVGITLTQNIANATGGAGIANSSTGLTITQNDNNDVAFADTLTGIFLDLNMTLDNSNAGGSVTRLTNAMIDVDVTLTETAGIVAMTSGIIDIDITRSAGTPELEGTMISCDVSTNVSLSATTNIYATSFNVGTGLVGAENARAYYADINETAVGTDASFITGYEALMTGFATGRADLTGFKATFDGTKSGGDVTHGILLDFNGTMNSAGELLYGSKVDFDGVVGTSFSSIVGVAVSTNSATLTSGTSYQAFSESVSLPNTASITNMYSYQTSRSLANAASNYTGTGMYGIHIVDTLSSGAGTVTLSGNYEGFHLILDAQAGSSLNGNTLGSYIYISGAATAWGNASTDRLQGSYIWLAPTGTINCMVRGYELNLDLTVPDKADANTYIHAGMYLDLDGVTTVPNTGVGSNYFYGAYIDLSAATLGGDLDVGLKVDMPATGYAVYVDNTTTVVGTTGKTEIYIDADVAALGAAASFIGSKINIDETVASIDASFITAYDTTITGLTAGRADFAAYKCTFDGAFDTGADSVYGLYLTSTATYNNAKIVYGADLNFSGITHTNAVLYGVNIILPQAVAAGSATGINVTADTVLTSNPLYGIVSTKELTGAIAADRTFTNYNAQLTNTVSNTTAGNFDITDSANVLNLVMSHTTANTGGTPADIMSGDALQILVTATTGVAGDVLTYSAEGLVISATLTETAGTLNVTATDLVDIGLATVGSPIYAAGNYNIMILTMTDAGIPVYGATTYMNGLKIAMDSVDVTDVNLFLRGLYVAMPTDAAVSTVYGGMILVDTAANNSNSAFGLNISKDASQAATTGANITLTNYAAQFEVTATNADDAGWSIANSANVLNLTLTHTANATANPIADTFSGTGLNLTVTATTAANANNILTATPRAVDITYTATFGAASTLNLNPTDIVRVNFDVAAGTALMSTGAGTFNCLLVDGNGFIPANVPASAATMNGVTIDWGSATLFNHANWIMSGLDITMPTTTYPLATLKGINLKMGAWGTGLFINNTTTPVGVDGKTEIYVAANVVGLAGATSLIGSHLDINELTTASADGTFINGYQVTMTGLTAGRADFCGYKFIMDGTFDTGADNLYGFLCDPGMTLNFATKVFAGVKIETDGITKTAGLVYGVSISDNGKLDAGVLLNVASGRAPAVDANLRGTVSGRIEHGAPQFYDDMWAGELNTAWATRTTTGAVTAGNGLNGRVLFTTGVAAGNEESVDFSDDYNYTSETRPTFEVGLLLGQDPAADTDIEAYVGLVDANQAQADYEAPATMSLVMLEIDDEAHGNDNWWLVCSNGGGAAVTKADTGIAGSVAYITLRFEYVTDTSVQAYINGVAAGAAIAANVPAGKTLQPCLSVRSALGGGAGAKTMTVDFVKTWSDRA